MIDNYGRFEGRLITEWDDDGRTMVLVEPFRYVDPKGMFWDCPAGYRTDGASIPKLLWSFAGGPFSGRYRKAAIPHDVFCDNRVRPWEDTHQMFWHAMLCAGVGEHNAALMYRAVYNHGPRWDAAGKDLVHEYPEEW